MKLSPKIYLLLCVAIAALPIFAGLDKLPVQLWDESRLAMNSYEMYKAGHWLVSTFNETPDMWNTKPPFVLWFQILSFKIFGVTELALRLPSAFAGVLTSLVVYWFFARRKEYLTGLISVVVLVTSMGFIKYHHSPRTGDYDALLTLFTTSYGICYFIYLEEENRRYLVAAILLIILAAFTKATAGVIFVPALAIYTIYRKKLVQTLKDPILYVGILAFFMILVSFYLIREQYTPGYIKAAIENDWVGRFNGNADIPNTNKSFYYDFLVGSYFGSWYVLMFCGIMLGLVSTNKYTKHITAYLLISALFFFLIITSSKVKKDWYDMPIYPMISMLTAIGIMGIFNLLLNAQITDKAAYKKSLPYVFLLVVCLPPYIRSVQSSIYPDPGAWIEYNTNVCRYLKDIYQNNIKPDGELVIVKGEYSANVEWYAKVISDRRKIPAKVIEFEQILPTQKVIAFHHRDKAKIESAYHYNIVENLYGNSLTIYQLAGKKE